MSASSESFACPSFEVARTKISAVNTRSAIDSFFEFLDLRAGGYVAVADSNSVVIAQDDDRMRDILNSARLVLPDGAPLSWIGRMKVGDAVGRVTGTAFFEGVLRDPRAKGHRHFLFGGETSTLAALRSRLEAAVGKDAVVGSYAPPYRGVGARESDPVLAAIRATRPSILWIGLGAPKQEYWMADHAHHFEGALCVGVGAAFDFMSGRKSRAPSVMRVIGLEWCWRLVVEPKRLWPRYRRVVPHMLRILGSELAAVVKASLAWPRA